MMIDVRDLWKVYEVGEQTIEAVRAIDLQVAEGEFVSIVGHSGSGKSTLLSMIGGLTKPTRGAVAVAGEDLWGLGDDRRSEIRNRRIGFIFQFASLIPTLRAIENVVLPKLFDPAGVGRSAYEEARTLLDLVGLTEKMDAYPGELSGGQQRRVAIARALINRPEIVLADEPTGDLDEQTEEEVMGLLFQVNRQSRTTFLLVTHNRSIALRADRMFQMKSGSLAA